MYNQVSDEVARGVKCPGSIEMWQRIATAAFLSAAVFVGGCARAELAAPPAWETSNPITSIAPPPLGLEFYFEDAKELPTPARVRLGRWLFYDTRLSGDNSVSCATCHRPEHAFSEPTAVSAGIRGQKGQRKAPTFINQAVTLEPTFFWDGRAGVARGPGARPDRKPDRDGQQPRLDDRGAVGRPRLQAVLRGGLRQRRGDEGTRGQGDRRLRAHARQRQLAVRQVALQPGSNRRCRRRPSAGTTCSSTRRAARSATSAAISPTAASTILASAGMRRRRPSRTKGASP